MTKVKEQELLKSFFEHFEESGVKLSNEQIVRMFDRELTNLKELKDVDEDKIRQLSSLYWQEHIIAKAKNDLIDDFMNEEAIPPF